MCYFFFYFVYIYFIFIFLFVCLLLFFLFFFFQAEDGIRDVAVTGVQTCALPISRRRRASRRLRPRARHGHRARREARRRRGVRAGRDRRRELAGRPVPALLGEIGRASCRERVDGRGGEGAVERKGVGGWEGMTD